jgi:hypothetical protein
MEGAEKTGTTRQSRRKRTKTPKALEQEERRSRGNPGESDSGETDGQVDNDESDIKEDNPTAATPPGAPRPNRTIINPDSRNQIAPKLNHTLTAKAGERPANGKANTASNAQNMLLINLVTSLVKAIEEQKQTHTDQIEALTRTLTEQINTLRAEIVAIQAHLANIQTPPSATPSYADIARTPPSSWPSNLSSLPTMDTTPSTITDTPYCTVDISRVEEENKNKTQPGAIRQAIEQEMRTIEGHENWRCVAVIKDPRNTTRIRVTCRNEAELQRVKEAAQKSAVAGARVMRDQLHPVKVDNANRTAVLDQDGAI